jgi:hypothetical protein
LSEIVRRFASNQTAAYNNHLISRLSPFKGFSSGNDIIPTNA